MTDAALPRYLSFIAVALGGFDFIRAAAHTFFVGPVAANVAGLDLTGHTGLDQVTLMVAFGASNFITGAALIFAGLTSRTASLFLLAVIPLAYLSAGVSLKLWSTGLEGVGAFPGTWNMAVYNLICVTAVCVAAINLLRRRRTVS